MEEQRRCVYIGLGGVGIRTILKTKKLFIDQYGQVPPHVQFLGIDRVPVFDLELKNVGLEPSECCLASTPILRDFYDAHKQEFAWMPPQNVNALSFPGACPFRTNGRMAFIFNEKIIENAIRSAIARVMSTCEDSQYCPPINVGVVFSTAGGTGGGMFLDVAYLIRKIYEDQVLLKGYVVLPKIFKEMVKSGPGVRHCFPNTFGALLDLDYLMQLESDDDPITFNWLSNSFSAENFRKTPTPFDLIYLIDNVNVKSGEYYNNIDDLVNCISLTLYSNCTKMGLFCDTIFDTCRAVFQSGEYDIMNKKAWVSSLGTSSIVFYGETVARAYEAKVAISLIQRVLNCVQDGDVLAIEWLDRTGIRDAIDIKRPTWPFSINDPKNPLDELNKYYALSLDDARITAGLKLEKRIKTLTHELADTVSGFFFSGNGCITTTRDFLTNLLDHIKRCIDDLNKEKESLETADIKLKCGMRSSADELQEEMSRLLTRSSRRISIYTNDLITAYGRYSDNGTEIIRRQFTISLFERLIPLIEAHLETVDRIIEMMDSVREKYNEWLSRTNLSDRHSLMEIDLTKETIRGLEIDYSDLSLKDFYGFLDENGLVGLESVDELEMAFENYAKSLPEYRKWKERSVQDVIETLPQEDFLKLSQRAFSMAEPLLKAYRDCPFRINVIGIEDKKRGNSRFDHDLPSNPSERIEVREGGSKHRIVIYCQDMIMPVFRIDGLEDMKKEYVRDSERYSCHFDERIYSRMIKEGFSMYPQLNHSCSETNIT